MYTVTIFLLGMLVKTLLPWIWGDDKVRTAWGWARDKVRPKLREWFRGT